MYAAYGRNTQNSVDRRMAEANLARRIQAEEARLQAERLEAAEAAVIRQTKALEIATCALSELMHSPAPVKRVFTYREIERRACDLFGLKPSEIKSQRRNRRVVLARQFVMYWSVRLTKLSLRKIGQFMNRDHATVLHGKETYVSKRKAMKRTLRRAR